MKNKKNLPIITVILPTFNEEKIIERCLKSIRGQNYPQEKIEILVIDDYSTDKTVKIAKKFNVKVVYNGSHDCQIARAIGLRKARGKLVLNIDADNVLPNFSWIRKSVQAFCENTDLVGTQPCWYKYNPNDHLINRYCALFGVTHPLPFYLKKRSFMMTTEKKWMYPKTLAQEKENYFLLKFAPENMPTLGAQGFLVKRELLLKTTYEPMFFHIDSILDLVRMGHNFFAMIKLSIEHQYTQSFLEYYQKLYRYTANFLRYRNMRRYTYFTSALRCSWALFLMMTVVVPFIESIKGFLKIRDFAWFLHPLFCFTTPFVSAYAVLKWRIRTE